MHCRIFPPFTFSPSPFPPLISSCPPHTCVHAVTHLHTHTHVQDGKTALMVACENKQEAAAKELMEATKLADALDLQVGHGA